MTLSAPTSIAAISLTGTLVSYGAGPVLVPLTLEMNEQRIGIVGRNGSGKSTFLHSLIGQLPLRAGQLSLGNFSVQALHNDHLLRAKHVSFVQSMFVGVEALTLHAYVSLGRLPYLGAFGKNSDCPFFL